MSMGCQMINRHQKPEPKIPQRCPKCHSVTVIDDTYQYGKRVDSWKCIFCGLNGDSDGFVDVINKTTVKI